MSNNNNSQRNQNGRGNGEEVTRHFCGVFGQQDESGIVSWYPINLRNPFLPIGRINGIEFVDLTVDEIISINENDPAELNYWWNIVLVKVDDETYEVHERTSGKILAKGQFQPCLMLIGCSRKVLVRGKRSLLEQEVQTSLDKAGKLADLESQAERDAAWMLSVKARQIALWLRGEFKKATLQRVREIRLSIRDAGGSTLEGRDERKEAEAQEQEAVVIVAAVEKDEEVPQIA